MRSFFVSAVALLFATNLFAQSKDIILSAEKGFQPDSLSIEHLHRASYTAPNYILYPTENVWTFLELETSTGRIWQVQHNIDDEWRFKSPLNLENYARMHDGVLGIEGEEYAGRFELLPTKSTYQFLLFDSFSGKIWQVQWSLDSNNRGILGEIK